MVQTRNQSRPSASGASANRSRVPLGQVDPNSRGRRTIEAKIKFGPPKPASAPQRMQSPPAVRLSKRQKLSTGAPKTVIPDSEESDYESKEDSAEPDPETVDEFDQEFIDGLDEFIDEDHPDMEEDGEMDEDEGEEEEEILVEESDADAKAPKRQSKYEDDVEWADHSANQLGNRALSSEDLENITKFRDKLKGIINVLKEFADGTPPAEFNKMDRELRPIAWSTYGFLRKRTSDTMFDTIIPYFDESVQAILGKSDLTVDDLLRLPQWERGCSDWGVYLDVALKKASDKPEHATADVGGQLHEVGLYVGSCTRMINGGISQRILEHVSVAKNTSEKGAPPQYNAGPHVIFTGRSSVRMNFRAIARFPRGHYGWKTFVLFTEGLTMAYLGTILAPRRNRTYHNEASWTLLGNTRGNVPDLPDVGKYALNGAWPLLQGLSRIPKRLKTGCGNCGKPEPEVNGPTNRFVGAGPARRCSACLAYMYRHKKERPERIWNEEVKNAINQGCFNCRRPENGPNRTFTAFYGTGEKRRCWGCHMWHDEHGGERPEKKWPVEQYDAQTGFTSYAAASTVTEKNGCKNCKLPEELGSWFAGGGSERRCNACHQYWKANGYERPESRWSVTNKAVQADDGNIRDGCGNCLAPEDPDPARAKRWKGFGKARRCRACQAWSQRNGNKERPASVYTETVKAGCGHCGASEPRDRSLAKYWIGSGEDRRCGNCLAYMKIKGEERPIALQARLSGRQP